MPSGIEVGVVGLGEMGGGIARNLVRARHRAAGWDIAEEARRRIAGEVPLAAPAEMAAAGAAIFFAVPGTSDIEAGLDALLARASDGAAIYDLTTSFPDDTRRLAERAAAAGVPYLDAGMSGGAAGADAGTLTLMVGGDRAAFDRTRHFLDAIAANVFHLGGTGAGHTMKLVHNMVCHTVFLATCEGGRLCERAGLSLDDMIAVFNVSNARSHASEVRFPRHILSERWDARSRIRNLGKDLEMAMRLAETSGADTACSGAAHRFLQAALGLGMSESDFSLLYRDFERIRERRDAGRRG